VVLYAGKVMETADVYGLFDEPSHPYTRALLDCLPGRGGRMRSIGGTLPDPTDPPPGCRFAARCPHAVDACTEGDQPPLYATGDGDRSDDPERGRTSDADGTHRVACIHFGPGGDPSVVLGEENEAAEGSATETETGTGTGGGD
jgi:peptide/nickel transport system ATP-binding protein